MEILNVSANASFEELALKAKTPVLVDFWAPWCGPCRMVAPELVALSEEMGEKIQIVKVNIDDFADLAKEYKVLGVPTMILFKDGKEADRLVGYRPRKDIQAALEKQL